MIPHPLKNLPSLNLALYPLTILRKTKLKHLGARQKASELTLQRDQAVPQITDLQTFQTAPDLISATEAKSLLTIHQGTRRSAF